MEYGNDINAVSHCRLQCSEHLKATGGKERRGEEQGGEERRGGGEGKGKGGEVWMISEGSSRKSGVTVLGWGIGGSIL